MQLALAAAFFVVMGLAWSSRSMAAETSHHEWVQCTADADCMVIKGPCSPAAVHAAHQHAAAAFYADLGKKEKCVKQFWQLKTEDAAARCRLERCEIVAKEK
jgi:hypothetical protein